MDGLLSLLLFGAFAFLMMRSGCGSHVGHGGHHHSSHSDGAEEVSDPPKSGFTDPVCGMKVARNQGYVTHHQGMAYHLCSRSCLDKFESDPALYLSKDAPPPEAAHHGGH